MGRLLPGLWSRFSLRFSVVAACLLLAAIAPGRARACGCISPPPGPPVVQTGERILFIVGGGEVVAHIQVGYTGTDASNFGWIGPGVV